MEAHTNQHHVGWEEHPAAAGGRAGEAQTVGTSSSFLPVGDVGMFHFPSEGDHLWMQQDMVVAAAEAALMPWEGQVTSQLMQSMWLHSVQMLEPDDLHTGSLVGGAMASAASLPRVTDGGLIPAVPAFQMALLTDSENRRLLQENLRLLATIDRLNAEVSRVQSFNSRLRALQVQLALGLTENLEAEGGAERIHLLEFSRHPQELRQALSDGTPLEECRQALLKANRFWERNSGAKVFVHPHQFEETVDLMDKLDLRKQHVVVAESLVWKVMLSVFTLRSRLQVRVRSRRELGVVGTSAPSSSKASCSKPPGLEAASEDEWQRRENKGAVELSEDGGGNPAQPWQHTPDMTDSTLSKRQWERQGHAEPAEGASPRSWNRAEKTAGRRRGAGRKKVHMPEVFEGLRTSRELDLDASLAQWTSPFAAR